MITKSIPIKLVALSLISSMSVHAQDISNEKKLARLMYARLTGVVHPTDHAKLKQMEALIKDGKRFEAAKIATEEDEFYNITIRNMAAPMSNRNRKINQDLNDFIATFIGIVRDKANAKEILTGDYFYISDSTLAGRTVRSNLVPDVLKSNNHYDDLNNGVNLRKALKKSPQFVVNRAGYAVSHPEPAGLLTSRQWGAEHLVAGTNRRAFEYSFNQFLCMELSEFADSTDPQSVDPSIPMMISQDVTRTPQGDASVFQNKCKSCHNMNDYLRTAFGHFDFVNGFVNNTLVLDHDTATNGTPSANEMKVDATSHLPQKYYSNSNVFPAGFRVADTKWYNNTTYGPKAAEFGWRGPTKGDGIREFAAMLANSKAFSRCLVRRVFQSVCNREPDKVTEAGLIEALTDNFEINNYRIKGLFEQVATRPECLGN